MKLYTVLLRHAASLVSSRTARRVEISAEIAQHQARAMTDAGLKKIETLEAEDEKCRLALPRFTAYRPDKDPICPHCWIVDEEFSPVSQTSRREVYRCGSCKAEYTVSEEAQPVARGVTQGPLMG